MKLIKTSILSLLSTLIKMVSGLAITKAIAIYIGPSGLALVAQLQNFIAIALGLAQAGINNGVTKYAAEYGYESERIPVLLSTASLISLVASLLVGAVVALSSNFFSMLLLHSESYAYIFLIFGLTIILFVINNLLLSILNGIQEIQTWISISIIQSLYSLIFTTCLIYFIGIDGALIALVTNQSVTLLIVLFMLRRHKVIKLQNLIRVFDNNEAKKLISFSWMTLATLVSVPVANLYVRNHIGLNLDWDSAGYWQGIWYLSNTILTVITMTLSLYFLPKLSEINDNNLIRKELIDGLKFILPTIFVGYICIFFLRDLIINVVLTPNFFEIRSLFFWQLFGDFFKVISFIFAYYFLAKAKTYHYIFIQVFFSLLFVGLVVFWPNGFSLQSIVFSYFLTYFLCAFWTMGVVIYETQ